jgi:hypothetical protein
MFLAVVCYNNYAINVRLFELLFKTAFGKLDLFRHQVEGRKTSSNIALEKRVSVSLDRK